MRKILLAFTLILTLSFILMNQERVKASEPLREEVFNFLQDAERKQFSLSNEVYPSKLAIQDELSPYFTREFSSFFIDEMFWQYNGVWEVIATDFLIGFVPNFSYNSTTKVQDNGYEIIVSEFMPANYEGPVTWNAYTTTAVIAKTTDGGMIIKNIDGYLDESKMIEIIINNRMLVTDQSPIIQNGRTLVPIRGVFEALDGEVSWDAKTKTVTIKKDQKTLTLVLNSSQAVINGKKVKLDTAPIVLNGRTLVPLRFIAENLGASVNWDSAEKSVVIQK